MEQKLDFNGREQLYYQIYDIMFQDITNGKYEIGSLLPSENELMQKYNVSRATVRKAMEILSNEGLIEKRRGLGTCVKNLRPNSSLNRVVSYTRKKTDNQAIAYKKIIEHKEIKASKEFAEILALQEGESLIQLKRVRYADEKPMYLETNYFEKAWVPKVMEHDFSKESLRVFLSNYYNISWAYAKQEILAVGADEAVSELLSIPIGAPLLCIKRISYDMKNFPREYVVTYYRADCYSLAMELSI